MKENEIIAKEHGFIYKGSMYALTTKLDIDVHTKFLDAETGKEYGDYSYSDNPICDIPEDTLVKIKHRYAVRHDYKIIEIFNSKSEAEDFIAKATEKMK